MKMKKNDIEGKMKKNKIKDNSKKEEKKWKKSQWREKKEKTKKKEINYTKQLCGIYFFIEINRFDDKLLKR